MERFWSKVRKGSPDECWPWAGCEGSGGYGPFNWRKNRAYGAHRIAWILTFGDIPKGEGFHGTCVRHTCDNRKCCNPAHLQLGTQQDNVRDREHRGRGFFARLVKLVEERCPELLAEACAHRGKPTQK